MADILSKSNPVFASFAFYAIVLILKMVLVQLTVVYQRTSKQSYSSPEDIKMNDPTGKKELKMEFNNMSVERSRRAHLNDMENILPFLFISLLYITIKPVASTAILLFRVFTGVRLLHSIVYLGQVPQPARALCFLVGVVVNCIMGVQILMYYMK